MSKIQTRSDSETGGQAVEIVNRDSTVSKGFATGG